jgi:hypothetical protein
METKNDDILLKIQQFENYLNEEFGKIKDIISDSYKERLQKVINDYKIRIEKDKTTKVPVLRNMRLNHQVEFTSKIFQDNVKLALYEIKADKIIKEAGKIIEKVNNRSFSDWLKDNGKTLNQNPAK